MSRRSPLLVTVTALSSFIVLLVSPAHAGPVVADFDDGTLQDFSLDSANFDLTNPGSGGNPLGFLQLTDLVAQGPGGIVFAPSAFLGDLSDFASVQWDQFRPADANIPGFVAIDGPGGIFLHQPGANVTDAWESLSAPLDDGGAWTQVTGSGTFEQTRGNVSRLGFRLEVTDTTGAEAGLDNVRLVPIDDDGNGGNGGGGQVVPLPPALPAALVAVAPLAAVALIRRMRRALA